jgi:hypothetical protein
MAFTPKEQREYRVKLKAKEKHSSEKLSKNRSHMKPISTRQEQRGSKDLENLPKATKKP